MKLILVLAACTLLAAFARADLETGYFTQTVDHFSRNTSTFQQRYFVDDDTFFGGGPIFIYISGRLDAFQLVQSGEVFELKKQLNGLLFGLEHRFFGRSQPTPDTSVENLQYLSVEQAVADIASFIGYIKDTYEGVKASKVILFGEEYGGALAVWARQKFPHLVDGVWASSAYVNPQINHIQLAQNIGKTYRQIGGDRCYNA